MNHHYTHFRDELSLPDSYVTPIPVIVITTPNGKSEGLNLTGMKVREDSFWVAEISCSEETPS